MTALTRIVAPCLAGVLALGTAWAQTGSASGPAAGTAAGAKAGGQKSLARADQSFMKDAAQGGLAEVESSKLALQKASGEQVKSFAQKMVDDHTKANDELKTLAQSKGLTDLPTEPSMAQKAKLKALSTADAANFERRYVEEMGLKAHQDTVKLFQKASKDAKDADVKAWAAQKLPDLQQHLKMAQDLHATLGPKKDSAGATTGTRKE